MSRFLLALGLLVSLGGLGSAATTLPAQAERAETVPMGEPVLLASMDYGNFEYASEAIPLRNHYRARGYAANIVRKTNGRYAVRVFYGN